MPIEVKVVSDADYAAWLAASKKKFAALDEGRPASPRNRKNSHDRCSIRRTTTPITIMAATTPTIPRAGGASLFDQPQDIGTMYLIFAIWRA